MGLTRHTHQPRNGKKRARKKRARKGLGIDSAERLRAHRELQYLRNPSAERAAKLKEVNRGRLG